ncbi:MAG: LytR C-terminal domain-containing protein [Actinomycetota bacterium]
MTTTVVKWLVVLGAIVAGVLVLAKAFEGAVQPEGASTASLSPEPGKEPKPEKSPKPEQTVGVRLGIYNGTKEDGLATDVERELKGDDGYVIDQIGNTVDPQDKTTIYYIKGKDAEAAQALADAHFKDAFVLEFPADTEVDVDGQKGSPDKGVQVAIFIGEDYAPSK